MWSPPVIREDHLHRPVGKLPCRWACVLTWVSGWTASLLMIFIKSQKLSPRWKSSCLIISKLLLNLMPVRVNGPVSVDRAGVFEYKFTCMI